MLTQETSVTIKVLHKQGMGIKAIARELGISKNTVRRYLKKQGKPIYSPRPQRPSKLDPFKLYLKKRIDAAAPDWIPATVLFDEIVELGYTGKIRILCSYVAQFKPQKPSEPVVRFETPPGKQMQVDFTIIRRGRTPLKALVATLGYSRATYVHFFDHERTDAWLKGIVGAFEFFGGVAHEILFDNAKAIMIERDVYGEGQHRWNAELLNLAERYGFKPKVCRPYRARTKGKVERFNHYLKNSFIVPLKATLSSAGLQLDVKTANAKIGPWLTNTANERVHQTTQAVPNQRLIEEQAVFLPLPTHNGNIKLTPFVTIETFTAPPFESLQHSLSSYDQLLGAPL
jgi:transposase